MKKKLLLSLIGVLLCLSVQAQDSLQIKQQVSAPYKLAVGFRYAAGPTALSLGITAKYFIREQAALEAYSDLNPESRHFLTSLSYVWQPKLATSARFRPYAGIGVGVLRIDNPSTQFFDGPASYTKPVGVYSFGVEYSFKKIPLALSLDYRSTFLRNGHSTPTYFSYLRANNIGLGLKYTFR